MLILNANIVPIECSCGNNLNTLYVDIKLIGLDETSNTEVI